MKTIFALSVFLTAVSAQGAAFTLIPSAETEASCRALGMAGEFAMKKNAPKSWTLFFAAGAKKHLNERGNGVYESVVRCAAGCMGYTEVRLNLRKREFYYWNSIDRRPEKCEGSVVAP